MKLRLVAATSVLGGVLALSAISSMPSAFADPMPSGSGTPSPTGGSFSPVPSPTGGSFSPVPSPTGGSFSPVPSPTGASSSFSPVPSPSRAQIPDAPKEQWPQPTLSVEPSNLPGGAHTIAGGPIVPGGKPLPFTLTVTNPGPHGALVRPQLVIGLMPGGPLPTAQEKVEIQREDGSWENLPAGPSSYFDAVPAEYGNVLYLEAGQSVDLPLRLSLTPDAPKSGWLWMNVYSYGLTLDAQDNPLGRTRGENFGFLGLAATAPSGSPTPSGAGSSTTPGSASTTPGSASTAPNPTSTTPGPATTAPNPTSTTPSAGSTAPTASSGPASPTPTALPAAATGQAPAAAVEAPSKATVTAAKAATTALGGTHTTRAGLASTGGGSDSLPIALAGAAALTVGTATLLVLRRRKGDHA